MKEVKFVNVRGRSGQQVRLIPTKKINELTNHSRVIRFSFVGPKGEKFYEFFRLIGCLLFNVLINSALHNVVRF